MNVAWEYAVLCTYSHFPDPNRGEKLWALQTRKRIEHGKVSTDELELFNELGLAGWRFRLGDVRTRLPESKLLDRHIDESSTGRVITRHMWLMERRLDGPHA